MALVPSAYLCVFQMTRSLIVRFNPWPTPLSYCNMTAGGGTKAMLNQNKLTIITFFDRLCTYRLKFAATEKYVVFKIICILLVMKSPFHKVVILFCRPNESRDNAGFVSLTALSLTCPFTRGFRGFPAWSHDGISLPWWFPRRNLHCDVIKVCHVINPCHVISC